MGPVLLKGAREHFPEEVAGSREGEDEQGVLKCKEGYGHLGQKTDMDEGWSAGSCMMPGFGDLTGLTPVCLGAGTGRDGMRVCG